MGYRPFICSWWPAWFHCICKMCIRDRENVGKKKLVLDLSCRKKDGDYYIVTDRWQKYTRVTLNEDVLDMLASFCDEFLILSLIHISLPREKQEEEVQNIRNGLNFAKKVLSTGECDMLILDEVLGLVDNHIITIADLKNVLDMRDGETDIIMTGISLEDDVCALADYVSEIRTVK